MRPRRLSKFIACLTSDNALTPSHSVKTGWQETVKPTTLKQALANRGALWRSVVGATLLWRASPCRSRDSSETRLVSTSESMSISATWTVTGGRKRLQNTLMAGLNQIRCENSMTSAEKAARIAGSRLITD
jgi:hypothetical protein